MADQSPGGIVYDGEHGKLGVSDDAVKELSATVQHVADRFFDTFDRHPEAVVFAIAIIVVGLGFLALRARDRVTLNRELRDERHVPAHLPGQQPAEPPQIQPPGRSRKGH